MLEDAEDAVHVLCEVEVIAGFEGEASELGLLDAFDLELPHLVVVNGERDEVRESRCSTKP